MKYICENCGLRYSDQSTLNAHKQNYCSKRVSLSTITENFSPSSSSFSSRTCSPVSSSSTSQASNELKSPVGSCNKDRKEKRVHEQSNDHVNSNQYQLLKSVIYQCNSCVFQSDKKSIMNRHSRIHLPLKRKQMEESCISPQIFIEPTLNQTSPGSSTVNQSYEFNDDLDSFCRECDIQFSSFKTFRHHRLNYCQKYKAIESMIKIEAGQTENSIALAQIADDHTNFSKQRVAKSLNFMEVHQKDIIQKNDCQELKNDHESDTPLDLSMKNKQTKRNTEKSFNWAIDELDSFSLNKSKQHKINNQVFTFFPINNTQKQLSCNIKSPVQENCNSVPLEKFNTSEEKIFKQLKSISNCNLEKNNPIQIDNKLFHCKTCQKLFLDLKMFEKHVCSNQSLKFNKSKNRFIEKSPIEMNIIKDVDNVTKGQETSKYEQKKSSNFENLKHIQSFLKHPLVIKTLKELYGHEDVTFCEELNSPSSKTAAYNLFYMCTTCGYRGNTARGVKQHGKLHLVNRQHFAVINATEKQALLIYNSENDSSDFNFSKKYTHLSNLGFETQTSESNNCINFKHDNKDSNFDLFNTKLPQSKKARLLNDYQKNLNEQEASSKGNLLKLVKAQTFCFKCNIQFQHLDNYITHKKTYCIHN